MDFFTNDFLIHKFKHEILDNSVLLVQYFDCEAHGRKNRPLVCDKEDLWLTHDQKSVIKNFEKISNRVIKLTTVMEMCQNIVSALFFEIKNEETGNIAHFIVPFNDEEIDIVKLEFFYESLNNIEKQNVEPLYAMLNKKRNIH